jgi:hypothetical protein
MQIPEIGDTVHYQAFGTPGGEYPSVPRCAMVTQVVDPVAGVVGLAVLNPAGLFFNPEVKYSAETKPGCWSYRPSFKG